MINDVVLVGCKKIVHKSRTDKEESCEFLTVAMIHLMRYYVYCLTELKLMLFKIENACTLQRKK